MNTTPATANPDTTMNHQTPASAVDDATRAQREPTNPYPPCMTRQQAAAWLGISVRHFAELEADRRARLPRVRLGRRVVYQIADLSRWMSERAGR
jgi:hypothetical protein